MRHIKVITQTLCILTIFLFTSCHGQESTTNKIDVLKVKEIKIINKVICVHNLKNKDLIISNRNEIEKILNELSYSKPVTGDINMKMNNGFFDISFQEGNIQHLYTINYTIYNGVILWNNGDLYRNNGLEVIIYQLFLE
jgi:hypothetical protein